jgi:hypothetical protein
VLPVTRRVALRLDRTWGRLCRDRTAYTSRAEAVAAVARLHPLVGDVGVYRCAVCAMRGRVRWHTTTLRASAPQPWGPIL